MVAHTRMAHLLPPELGPAPYDPVCARFDCPDRPPLPQELEVVPGAPQVW